MENETEMNQLPGIIVTIKIVSDTLGNLKNIGENKKDKIGMLKNKVQLKY